MQPGDHTPNYTSLTDVTLRLRLTVVQKSVHLGWP